MPIRRTVEWFENLVDPLRPTAGPHPLAPPGLRFLYPTATVARFLGAARSRVDETPRDEVGAPSTAPDGAAAGP